MKGRRVKAGGRGKEGGRQDKERERERKEGARKEEKEERERKKNGAQRKDREKDRSKCGDREEKDGEGRPGRGAQEGTEVESEVPRSRSGWPARSHVGAGRREGQEVRGTQAAGRHVLPEGPPPRPCGCAGACVRASACAPVCVCVPGARV